mmetsp:Transcript_3614/g.6856  ORF Transcript_3614/g.6856 Transcript_3614/m.6856 type:complete len:80 (-) Transcript_3614:292-531(-)
MPPEPPAITLGAGGGDDRPALGRDTTASDFDADVGDVGVRYVRRGPDDADGQPKLNVDGRERRGEGRAAASRGSIFFFF